MTLWNKKELLEALSDEVIQHNLLNNLTIDEVVIDSRKTPQNGLFIALKGEKNDGHDYLKQIFTNGCKVALIHNVEALKDCQNNGFILVKDTFVALYKLAKYSRQRSQAKIIAITGSVGKTSTKEMLKLAFSSQGKTYATFGNLNNHIGLPLTLCNFPADCTYGIFEMGMNHLGEIDPLSRITKPHLAIITTVGPVHIENFKNEEEIAVAKSEIFCGLVDGGLALLNKDNKHFDFLTKRAEFFKISGKNIISFGEKISSDYQILSYETTDVESSTILAKTKSNLKVSYKISSSNKSAIFNSIIILAALDILGNNVEKGLASLQNLVSVSGRGKILQVNVDGKNITIIDDSYNASVLSMRSGIDHLAGLKKSLNKKRTVAILGDMLELGEKSVELHNEVTNYLKEFQIDFAVLVGEKMTNSAKNLDKNFYKTFLNSTLCAHEIKSLIADGDILYVKGSRGISMEKIIEILTNQKSAH